MTLKLLVRAKQNTTKVKVIKVMKKSDNKKHISTVYGISESDNREIKI